MDRRWALVTGSSSGIGLEIGRVLDAEGFSVLGASRRAEGGLQLDLTSTVSVQQLVDDVLQRTDNRLDLLVNCAGIGWSASVETTSPDEIARVIATNLTGPIQLTNALIPLLTQTRGQIVFISSIAARRGFAGWASYCASKSGLEGYANALRDELRPRGIRVSVVRPGAVRTPLYAHRSDTEGFMEPATIAKAVAFLVNQGDPNAIVDLLEINNVSGDL